MNRRTFLGAAAGTGTVFLAGCVSGADDDDPENGNETAGANGDAEDSEDENGDEDPEAQAGPTYTAVGDEITDNRRLHHEVSVGQPALFDEDEPLAISLTLTNEGEEAITYGERRDAEGLDAQSNGFILQETDGDHYEYEDSWWSLTERMARTADFQTSELAPGESHTVERVVVVADTDSNPDDAPDELRFEVSFSEATDEAVTDGDGYEWRFSLERDS